MRAFAVISLLLSSGALVGCATRNARLDLDIALPDSSSIDHVELLVLPNPVGFGGPEWAQAPVEVLDELGETARVQILAEASIEQPLAVRVRFCEEAVCADSSAEVRARYERAFYVAEVTRHTLAIDAVPLATGEPREVSACAVGGCLLDGSGNFCRIDGTHYCE